MDRTIPQQPFDFFNNDIKSLSERARRAMQPNGGEAQPHADQNAFYLAYSGQDNSAEEPLAGLFRGPKLSDRLR
ncbi:hypothetical protein [Roseibium sp.]|uniref:hypothetical protein n=1 Tax=Roseibium sp. TaxID=1936156 RepID=UPI003B524B04